ncbi:MAG TPA: hypothetical protein VGK30_17240 [Candidatus Binatia bacterium]|jgi:hypothetical protein
MRALVFALALVLLTPARSLAQQSQPTPNPLDACQQNLARASRSLGDNTRRGLGRCIAAGLRCLTGSADAAACCTAAAPRCVNQATKIARAEQRFAGRVRTGRCAAVPFATILDPAGLGFATAGDACRCLTAPVEVTDLHTLGLCLAQLVDGQTTRLLALAETPRAVDALACVGLNDVIDSPQSSIAVLACSQPTGAPTSTPTVGGTPAATVTLANGATPPATRTPRPSRTPKDGATPVATATATSPPTGTASPTVIPTPSATAHVPTPSPTSTAVCGNGIVEGDEECDGNAFDDSTCLEDICTCEDFCDDAGGRLACNRDCTADFSRCTGGGCEF